MGGWHVAFGGVVSVGAVDWVNGGGRVDGGKEIGRERTSGLSLSARGWGTERKQAMQALALCESRWVGGYNTTVGFPRLCSLAVDLEECGLSP